MITFGGRPLNTYRGGSSKSNEPRHIEVQPESVTFNSDNFQKNEPQINQEIKTNLNSAPIESFEPNGPIVIKVQPESVTIAEPGSKMYEESESNLISNANPNSFTIGGTVLNHKQLVKLDKELIRARFKNGFFAKIFGVEIVTVCIYIASTSRVLFSLFILFIILCICSILYGLIQGILNFSHLILDGVSITLRGINDLKIEFEIKGLFKFSQRIFGGALDGAIRDVDKANNSYPRKAYILIIDILKAIFKSLPDTIQTILEGLFNGIQEIFK